MRHPPLALLATLLLACDDAGTTLDEPAPAVDARLPDAAVDAGQPRDASPPVDAALDAALPQARLVTPVVEFGEIEAEQRVLGALVLANTASDTPLVVTEVVGLAAPFRVADGLLPLTAAAGRNAEILLHFEPLEAGTFERPVTVVTNAGDFEARLRGRARPAPPRSCLQAVPAAVDLGRLAWGQQSARWGLDLENCGDQPVTVRQIALEHAYFHWEGMLGELAPRGRAALQVWYQNEALFEGQADHATLVVQHSGGAPLEVPLTITGGGEPTCDLLVVPQRWVFGAVTVGRTATQALQIVNRGTAACELRGEHIEHLVLPDLDFRLTPRPLPLEIPPAAFSPIEVTYAPARVGARSAQYVATYWDPYREEERAAIAELSGLGVDPQLVASRVGIEFGPATAGQCAAPDQSVVISTPDLGEVCISAIRLEGDCEGFLLVDQAIAPGECLPITQRAPHTLTLGFQPPAAGARACTLVVQSDTAAVEVRLRGEGVPAGRVTERFEQAARVDLLFVVDDTPSAAEEVARLAAAVEALPLAGDYQVGVITSDLVRPEHAGQLQGVPRILRPGRDSRADLAATLAGLAHVGGPTSRGLEAARRALSDPLTHDAGVVCARDGDCALPDQCQDGTCGGTNRGFLRPAATLEVVFVSDRDDSSPATLEAYADFFRQIKGLHRDGRMRLHALAGALEDRAAFCRNPTGEVVAAERYVAAAQATGGHVFSLCAEDHRPHLAALADAFALPRAFPLARSARAGSLAVRVDDRPTEAWQYDEPAALLTFDRAPAEGQTVAIGYEPVCWPRRE